MLSRDLSLDCVTEGVETARPSQMLTDMGRNLIQVYIYSRHLTDIDVEPIIDRQTGHMRTALG
ncbi:hypothetical protein [Rhizobium sp. 22-785-1]